MSSPVLSDRARRGDPPTSQAAGDHAEQHRTPIQLRILSMFRLYGPMTDERLLMVLNDAERGAGIRPTSPSGARSRRSELSKPNMDRLDELTVSFYGAAVGWLAAEEQGQAQAKAQLRIEGLRSPLWAVGTEKNARGFTVVVWGLAE